MDSGTSVWLPEMPNGKVGDHWYTDVTDHRLPTFSAEIDALIRELDAEAAGDRPYTPWDDPKKASGGARGGRVP